jgi:hypothetical protein
MSRAGPAGASGAPPRLHVLREAIVAIMTELRPSDTDIEQALRRAITSVFQVNHQAVSDDQTETTPHLTGPPDVGRIRVTVSGGVATLAGTARSLAEGQAVIAAVRAVPHLHGIDNRLRINPNV